MIGTRGIAAGLALALSTAAGAVAADGEGTESRTGTSLPAGEAVLLVDGPESAADWGDRGLVTWADAPAIPSFAWPGGVNEPASTNTPAGTPGPGAGPAGLLITGVALIGIGRVRRGGGAVGSAWRVASRESRQSNRD